MTWTDEKNPEEIDAEFSRIAEIVITQGDIDCILELASIQKKKEFINGWHECD